MRMLTAFPTARGLARHMQQAAANQLNSASTGKVGTDCHMKGLPAPPTVSGLAGTKAHIGLLA